MISTRNWGGIIQKVGKTIPVYSYYRNTTDRNSIFQFAASDPAPFLLSSVHIFSSLVFLIIRRRRDAVRHFPFCISFLFSTFRFLFFLLRRDAVADRIATRPTSGHRCMLLTIYPHLVRIYTPSLCRKNKYNYYSYIYHKKYIP